MSLVCIEIASMIVDNIEQHIARITSLYGIWHIFCEIHYSSQEREIYDCDFCNFSNGRAKVLKMLKDLRMISWAFSQVIDLKFMITKTNCDFGRSWGTNIMRINAALGEEIWYIFPHLEDHLIYIKERIDALKEYTMKMIELCECLRDLSDIKLYGIAERYASSFTSVMRITPINIHASVQDISYPIQRVHPSYIRYIDYVQSADVGEQIGMCKNLMYATGNVNQVYAEGERIVNHAMSFEELVLQMLPNRKANTPSNQCAYTSSCSRILSSPAKTTKREVKERKKQMFRFTNKKPIVNKRFHRGNR